MENSYRFNCDDCGHVVVADSQLRSVHQAKRRTHRFCTPECSQRFRRKGDTQVSCGHCKAEMTVNQQAVRMARFKKEDRFYCSVRCRKLDTGKAVETPCGFCGKLKYASVGHLKRGKAGKVFCDSKCFGRYNVQNKEIQYRSKMERLLCDMIGAEFPDLQIECNNRKALHGLELDIYLPTIKMGIEWNGIHHYQPIYGEEQFEKVKSRDAEKLIRAEDSGIHLVVIVDMKSKPHIVEAAFKGIKEIVRSKLTHVHPI